MDINPSVAYIFSKNLVQACNSIPVLKNRSSMVHSLIVSFSLTSRLKLVHSVPASEEDIRFFHSEDYVQYLKACVALGEDTDSEDSDDTYGIGFDCPPLQDTWTAVKEIAGASLQAADTLVRGESVYAINWFGGWHHAQRDYASGFCYVNDIVLAIQMLRKRFDRVLYIDLDVHHGDGVENAFCFTPKIMTVSLHMQEPGFFPGTGKVTDVGMGRGRFYSVNVPYKAGINDSQLHYLLQSVIKEVREVFEADAVVCQCGADTLTKDPLGGANISLEGYLKCIEEVLQIKKPTLFLGGGGYNFVNTSKLWSAIVIKVLGGEDTPEEIPEHQFFPRYGPDFTMEINASLRKTQNTQQDLDDVIATVRENLQNLKPEPVTSST